MTCPTCGSDAHDSAEPVKAKAVHAILRRTLGGCLKEAGYRRHGSSGRWVKSHGRRGSCCLTLAPTMVGWDPLAGSWFQVNYFFADSLETATSGALPGATEVGLAELLDEDDITQVHAMTRAVLARRPPEECVVEGLEWLGGLSPGERDDFRRTAGQQQSVDALRHFVEFRFYTPQDVETWGRWLGDRFAILEARLDVRYPPSP